MSVGSHDLSIPAHLTEGIHEHLETLREAFKKRRWGNRGGYGTRPALVVIDLAKAWTEPDRLIGSNLNTVVESTRRLLDVAREARVPVFFTVVAYGQDDPRIPSDGKKSGNRDALAMTTDAVELDPRLGRRPTEKIVVKKYASCFKGTDFQEMLTSLGIDTLIVTGCSTLHCVYATCIDAATAFHVVVPREAVGDRCELFHLVALLDIDMTKGDVVSEQDVIAYLRKLSA
jgi:nicotinamidase-related amidase